jgi:hypothetical protein
MPEHLQMLGGLTAISN